MILLLDNLISWLAGCSIEEHSVPDRLHPYGQFVQSFAGVRAVILPTGVSRYLYIYLESFLSLLSLSFSLLTIFSGEGRWCFRAPSFVFSFAPTIMSNNSRSYPGAASASNWSCLHTQTQSRIVCVRVSVCVRQRAFSEMCYPRVHVVGGRGWNGETIQRSSTPSDRHTLPLELTCSAKRRMSQDAGATRVHATTRKYPSAQIFRWRTRYFQARLH